MLVFVRDVLLAVLDGNPVSDLLVEARLFKNDIYPTPDDVIGDYVEADFDGYAPQDFTLNASYLNPFGLGQMDSEAVEFDSTGTTANTIYGVFILDGAGELVGAERFITPLLIQTVDAFVPYTLHVTASGT